MYIIFALFMNNKRVDAEKDHKSLDIFSSVEEWRKGFRRITFGKGVDFESKPKASAKRRSDQNFIPFRIKRKSINEVKEYCDKKTDALLIQVVSLEINLADNCAEESLESEKSKTLSDVLKRLRTLRTILLKQYRLSLDDAGLNLSNYIERFSLLELSKGGLSFAENSTCVHLEVLRVSHGARIHVPKSVVFFTNSVNEGDIILEKEGECAFLSMNNPKRIDIPRNVRSLELTHFHPGMSLDHCLYLEHLRIETITDGAHLIVPKAVTHLNILDIEGEVSFTEGTPLSAPVCVSKIKKTGVITLNGRLRKAFLGDVEGVVRVDDIMSELYINAENKISVTSSSEQNDLIVLDCGGNQQSVALARNKALSQFYIARDNFECAFKKSIEKI